MPDKHDDCPFDPVAMGRMVQKVDDIHGDMQEFKGDLKELKVDVKKQNSRVTKLEEGKADKDELARKASREEVSKLRTWLMRLTIMVASGASGATIASNFEAIKSLIPGG